MRPVQSAVRAFTSVLGSLGQGTATEQPNFSFALNPAAIAPAASITFNAPAFTAKTTGKVLVVGMMGVATQAAADEVEFILLKDGGGFVANMFANGVAGAGLPLCGATLLNVDTIALGVPHTYGIEAVLIQPGGHQIQVVFGGEIAVLVYELP